MNTSIRTATILVIALLSSLINSGLIQAQNSLTKIEKLDELLNKYEEHAGFNGSILVAHEGKMLYKKGFGLANREWNVQNTFDTKFRIGSVTKQFTSMLIIQLLEENQLKLDEPISSYLPDYPKEKADKITIHQLLTHSSGTPEVSFKSKNHYKSDELAKLIGEAKLDFTPGSKFKYSNSGYSLLGIIIEKITGKPYQQVIQEKIFSPLEMNHSGFDNHRTIINNRASGYFKSWGTYYNSNYIDMSSVYSAGALYSTAEDLYKWDQALYTEKLISKKFIELLFTKHIKDSATGGFYGYGWEIREKTIGNTTEKVHSIGHDGAINGFCAIFTRIPETNSTIIILSNTRRSPLNAITRAVTSILYDKTYDFPKMSLAYTSLKIIENESLEKALRHFEKGKTNSAYYLDEVEMNVIGYKLLQADNLEAAKSIFQFNVEAFPKSANTYDSYGEILNLLGKKEEAIKHYKKSIKLNPENENGFKMLEKLGVNTSELRIKINVLETEDSWGQEIFHFPIHFAPDISFEGIEDARFPKGWSNQESDEFWTYVFAWNINLDQEITEVLLEKNLAIYFDGLMKGVNKDKGKILPKTKATLGKSKDSNMYNRHSGNLVIYDAFSTKAALKLNVQVDQYYCEKKQRSIIVFRFSPKAFDHNIWETLTDIKPFTDICD